MMRTSASDELASFQDAFAYALFTPDGAPPPTVAELVAQPAFAVYRNTVLKGCIDALQANYPAVARIVGEEWFRAAAAIYARETPPADPVLVSYGATFPDFLARFAPASEVPYLPAVAQLDRFWSEAHAARDEGELDPVAVSCLEPQALAGAMLRPHAAARWAWFDDAPVYTIWSRNRECGGDPAPDLDWLPEGALLTRPHDAVIWRPLDPAGCAFLDACAASGTLDQAVRAALAVQPRTNLAGLMAGLLECGAFTRMNSVNDVQYRVEKP